MGKVTIQSMAKELGLSRNTVAMALKDDPKVAPVTRERVLRMAKRNGYLGENVYVEEVRAPQEKHYNIMVLRTRDAAVYWNRVVSGISEEASLNNCQTRVAVVTEREEANGILPLGLNENIDAIFCIKMLPPEYMQKLVNLGYRIFQLDHYCGIEQRPMGDIVRVDGVQPVSLLTSHLIGQGMTRIGFQVTEHDADEAAKIADLPHIELEGMFTHFSCADQEDKTYCSMQMEKYDKMTALLAEHGVTIPLRHICNSAGIMEFDDHRFEMVRSGIITYGIYPSEEVKKERLDLIPALSWKSHVIHVKEVGPGIGVSYGATYVTEKPMTRIATVSAGYADGYPRALSNQGCVLIHGKKAPIIGRICMDQMMVDVTDIPDVQVEDVVTLVGTDGDETITIEEIANPAARFDYEMLCDISSRVTRVYK